jgi:hypothetical protein
MYSMASTEASSQAPNMRLTNVMFRRTLSEIKLKEQILLDLSQIGKESWRRELEKRRKDQKVKTGGLAWQVGQAFLGMEVWSVQR